MRWTSPGKMGIGEIRGGEGSLGRVSIGVILGVAFLLRLVALLIHHGVATLPQGGADEVAFERLAWTLSQNPQEGASAYIGSGARLLAFLGSFVYDLTGRAPYMLGAAMVLLGTILVYVLYVGAFVLWDDRATARVVAWSGALFPQLIQHSALFLRETPVALCLAAAGYSAVCFIRRHSLIHIAWFSLWVLLGTLFHSGVVIAVPALLVGLVLVRPRGSRRRLPSYALNTAAVIALAGLIFWLNQTGYGLGKFGGSFDDAIETFQVREALDPRGGAAYPEWMILRGGASEAWKVPIRYGTFLFSPLIPFMVRSPIHLLGVIDATLYLLMVLILLRNWREFRTNRAGGVLLAVTLSLFLVYSLGVSNFGTAIRHRAKVAPLLILLTAGIPTLKRQKALGASIHRVTA